MKVDIIDSGIYLDLVKKILNCKTMASYYRISGLPEGTLRRVYNDRGGNNVSAGATNLIVTLCFIKQKGLLNDFLVYRTSLYRRIIAGKKTYTELDTIERKNEIDDQEWQ